MLQQKENENMWHVSGGWVGPTINTIAMKNIDFGNVYLLGCLELCFFSIWALATVL